MMDKEDKLFKSRHSLSHILAYAMIKKYGNIKFAIGPVIENGFYYDFDLDTKVTQEDLIELETIMQDIIKCKHNLIQSDISKEDARVLFKDQTYKLELIDEIQDKNVSIYKLDEFNDLCKGPHIENTSQINYKAFKLLSLAGAYWRGNEKNKMLQRIYGCAFLDPKQLKEHLKFLEEIKERDHRKIAKELDLFSFCEQAGQGLMYWHPKGALIRNEIENFWKKEHFKNDYQLINTPHIGKEWLWQTSGHLGFYNESMYAPIQIDNDNYYLKPMNCPFHIMIYKNKRHSYKELPLKYCELGTVYRYEKSGSLHGGMRVRGFTQDDAHIICRVDQMEEEIKKIMNLAFYFLNTFDFKDFDIYVSTRPDKSIGSNQDWELSTDALKKALENNNINYKIDEKGGAFYGPKIDIKIKDALNRAWQLSTIQFDFNLSERFDMYYIDKDNNHIRPYMIHRALFGSIERFFAILIEHFKGIFPVWLSPIQVSIIPVSDKYNDYALSLEKILKESDLRVYCDLSEERMNNKIRHNLKNEKVPYILIIGEQEKNNNTVSLRKRGENNNTELKIDELINFISNKIKKRSNTI